MRKKKDMQEYNKCKRLISSRINLSHLLIWQVYEISRLTIAHLCADRFVFLYFMDFCCSGKMCLGVSCDNFVKLSCMMKSDGISSWWNRHSVRFCLPHSDNRYSMMPLIAILKQAFKTGLWCRDNSVIIEYMTEKSGTHLSYYKGNIYRSFS